MREEPPNVVFRSRLITASATRVQVRIPTIGRFQVEAESAVRVEPSRDLTGQDIDCFVRGPLGAYALLLNGVVPLRAAAVRVDDRAVVICGPSACGKSTLAAGLGLRGHQVLADQILWVHCPNEPNRTAEIRPLVDGAGIQLWPDMVRGLGLDPFQGDLVRPTLAKRRFQLGQSDPMAPVRPGAVVVFDDDHHTPVRQIQGTERFSALVGREWHPNLVTALGLGTTLFRILSQLAATPRFLKINREKPKRIPPTDLARLVEESVR